MRQLAMLATALLLAFGGSSQAACQFESAKIYFGSESQMKGSVEAGEPCGFALSGAGPIRTGSFRVATPPHHGVAVVGENYGMPVVGYRSVAGYRGSDEFVVTFVGGDVRTPEAPGSIHVNMDVK